MDINQISRIRTERNILVKWDTGDENPSMITDFEVEEIQYKHKGWMNDSGTNESILIECQFSDVEHERTQSAISFDMESINDSQIALETHPRTYRGADDSKGHSFQTLEPIVINSTTSGDHIQQPLNIKTQESESSEIPITYQCLEEEDVDYELIKRQNSLHYYPYDQRSQETFDIAHHQTDASMEFDNNHLTSDRTAELSSKLTNMSNLDSIHEARVGIASQDLMFDEGYPYVDSELVLHKITDRFFITFTKEIPEYSVHCRRLVQTKNKICKILHQPHIYLLNTFLEDSVLTKPFNKVLNCFFDLKKRPKLDDFVDFSNTFYDWLAMDSSNIVLLHSAGIEAASRTVVILFCLTHYYASFGNSDISKVLVEAIYRITEATECEIPLVFLRYSSYMIKFSPGNSCSRNKASRNLYSLRLSNCPRFYSEDSQTSRFHIFYKLHHGIDLKQVFTTNIHELEGEDKTLLLKFAQRPLTIVGDVLLIGYFYQPNVPSRIRLFKILFNTCQENDDRIEFDRNSFDEVHEAIPHDTRLEMIFSKDSSEELCKDTVTTTCYESVLPNNLLYIDTIDRKCQEVLEPKEEECVQVLRRNSITEVKNTLHIDRYQCRMATLERSDDDSQTDYNPLSTTSQQTSNDIKSEHSVYVDQEREPEEQIHLYQNTSCDGIYDTEDSTIFRSHSSLGIKKNVSFSARNLEFPVATNCPETKASNTPRKKIKAFKKKLTNFVDKANGKFKEILVVKDSSSISTGHHETLVRPPKKTLKLDSSVFKRLVKKPFSETNDNFGYRHSYKISRIEESPLEDFDELRIEAIRAQIAELKANRRNMNSANAKELDKLIDELHSTAISFSNGRPPAPERTPMNTRFTARSTSLSGNNNLNDNLYSYKSHLNGSPANFTTGIQPRKLSADRHQSVFTTNIDSSRKLGTIGHYNRTGGSITNISSPSKYNEVHLTIDPKHGLLNNNLSRQSSNKTGSMNQISTFSKSHHYSTHNLVDSIHQPDQMTLREQELMKELMDTKKELETLRTSQLHLNQIDGSRMNSRSQFSRNFQSQSNLASGSSIRKINNINATMSRAPMETYSNYNHNSKTISSTNYHPKRAMSSTNVNGPKSWTIKDNQGSESDLSFMGDNFSTISGITGQNKTGYSARRERIKNEHEQERLRMLQQKSLRTRGSSNTLNSPSVNTMNGRRLQQNSNYRSMNSMNHVTEGETFEEVETITLQPIGRGVQDLESNLGSTTTLAHAANAKTASMMDVRGPSLRRTISYDQRKWSLGMNRNSSNRLNLIGDQKMSHRNQKDTFGSTSFNNKPNENKNQTFKDYSRQSSGFSRIEDQTDSIMQDQEEYPITQMNNCYMSGQPQETANIGLAKLTKSIWYKSKLSRDEAIRILRQLPPGSFLVRDSTTYENAYGLAVKVDTLPPKIQPKSDDMQSELVRHYLIEGVTSPEIGVRLKGFTNEPVFPDLESLIYQHTRDNLALPCKLILPNQRLVQNGSNEANGYNTLSSLRKNKSGTMSKKGNFISKLFAGPSEHATPTMLMNNYTNQKPGKGLNAHALLLGIVPIGEMLGEAGLMRAVDHLLPTAQMTNHQIDSMGPNSRIKYTECQLKIKPLDGITMTDECRKLFFRRHLTAESIIFAGVEQRNKEFLHDEHKMLGITKPRIFGIIQRKDNSQENQCFVFSDLDPAISAKQIVSFINDHFS